MKESETGKTRHESKEMNAEDRHYLSANKIQM